MPCSCSAAAKQGQVCSITRLVHFGPLSDELRIEDGSRGRHRRGDDCQDPARPHVGRCLRRHPAGLRHHGLCRRVAAASSGRTGRLRAAGSRGDAWGVADRGRGPDLCLEPVHHRAQSRKTRSSIGADGNEVLTVIDGWPMIDVEIDGRSRPAPGDPGNLDAVVFVSTAEESIFRNESVFSAAGGVRDLLAALSNSYS